MDFLKQILKKKKRLENVQVAGMTLNWMSEHTCLLSANIPMSLEKDQSSREPVDLASTPMTDW